MTYVGRRQAGNGPTSALLATTQGHAWSSAMPSTKLGSSKQSGNDAASANVLRGEEGSATRHLTPRSA